MQFSKDQVYRYARHIILPEVGGEGQRKLLDAKVLILGAGGLGSPIIEYLAAAGIGKLGIVDFDKVEVSNLQRQVIHSNKTVGKLKVDSAREFVNNLNPDVEVVTFNERLSSANGPRIVEDFDIIVDGSDNFPTRYLINDLSFFKKKPVVHGSIFRFEGQISVFDPVNGPCYRCLYPEPPPPGSTPSCQEAGVLGVLPGIVGSMQALEVIKLVIGKGEPLIGSLLLYDALESSFRKLKLRKDPDCNLCSDKGSIKELIDYELFCGIKG